MKNRVSIFDISFLSFQENGRLSYIAIDMIAKMQHLQMVIHLPC